MGSSYRDAVHNAIRENSPNPRSKKGVSIMTIRKHVKEHTGLDETSHFVLGTLRKDVENGILSAVSKVSFRFAKGQK